MVSYEIVFYVGTKKEAAKVRDWCNRAGIKSYRITKTYSAEDAESNVVALTKASARGGSN